jgi:hypothetical protein
MIEEEKKIIPLERGLEKKEEEIARLQKTMEEEIGGLKKLLLDLENQLKIAEAAGEEEKVEILQGQIFDIEHHIEKGEEIIMQGNWERFDLWGRTLKMQWKREDES